MNMHTPINDAEAEVRPAATRKRWPWLAGGTAVAAAAAALLLSAQSDAPPPAPPPPTVIAATPLQREVAEWDSYIGRFEASRSVEVRPRVSGQVTAIHFRDGATVSAGQLLFTIDPRPLEAQLAEADARLASARSDLALARTNLARANRLIGDDAISQSDVDELNARVRAAVATVAAGEALVRARRLDVEFTRVRAPISGRISDRRIDAGNLVAAGEGPSGTLLTTINALDPIYFTFNSSEALFLKMRRAQEEGAQPSPVEIRLQDETEYGRRGRLDFTDNGLDPRSGTIRGRAVVDNPGLFLAPGMFGDMRLANAGTERALLVPDTAIVTDQARKVVLVAGGDGTVSAKPVVLGALVDGLRVIRSGLAPQDRVVISGIQLVQPGGKAQVRPGRIAPQARREAQSVQLPTADAATIVAR